MKRKALGASSATGFSINPHWTATRKLTRNLNREPLSVHAIGTRLIHQDSYKHGVIRDLVSSALLRSVRTEIQENLSFTPKETDIYKIHQSGDLANLDGLEDSSLKLLPSLLILRDALYSSTFREYLSTVTGAGPLSGRKTDMAINVYTPGCHLLCHDDVIGSRRVSYILYLTDPDRPWNEEWGGVLRLYPTQTYARKDRPETKVPSPDFTISIPPAFNQLSFFAVQPGESFHDVEEVYAGKDNDKKEDDGGRVRMAISGWYHIPQEGEDGFEEGLEEKLAEKSSLMQLQGKGDAYDLPQPQIHLYGPCSELQAFSISDSQAKQATPDPEDDVLTETDIDFLLPYLNPSYLTPDTLSALSSSFADNSVLRLDNFLKPQYATSLHEYVTSQEACPMPTSSVDIDSDTPWTVARPPHKHRYLYMQPTVPSSFSSATVNASQDNTGNDISPLRDLLDNVFPSLHFRKWLQLATSLVLTSHNLLARRFRRGKDYSLATNYTEDASRLEITLGITPTKGWGDNDDPADIENPDDEKKKKEDDKLTATASPSVESQKEVDDPSTDTANSGEETQKEIDDKSTDTANPGEEAQKEKDDRPTVPAEPNNEAQKEKDDHPTVPAEPSNEAQKEKDDSPAVTATPSTEKHKAAEDEDPGVGGYEVYMAGDEDDDGDSDHEGSDHGVPIPPTLSASTGARASGPSSAPRPKSTKADPAIYRSSSGTGEEDDGVLFSMPAGWNRLSVVLRDKGVLRFVKYVGMGARGDRWDLTGEFGVEEEEGEEEAEEGEKVEEGEGDVGEEEEETEFEGFEGLGESSDESSD